MIVRNSLCHESGFENEGLSECFCCSSWCISKAVSSKAHRKADGVMFTLRVDPEDRDRRWWPSLAVRHVSRTGQASTIGSIASTALFRKRTCTKESQRYNRRATVPYLVVPGGGDCYTRFFNTIFVITIDT
jgi:hypothetical protein